jgi:hypothetical protein
VALTHYLLVFDRKEGHLVLERAFHDATEAAAAYAQCELDYRGNDNFEIVLVGADSRETLQLTHGNYFNGTPSASPFLAGV